MRALSPHGSGSGCFLAPSWTMSDDDSGRKPGHVVPWKTPWCDTVRPLVSISRTAIVHSCSSVNQLLQPPQKFRGGILAQLVKTNLSLVSTEEHLMRLYTILIIHIFFWSVLSCILLLISCWGGLSPATIISGEYHNYLLPRNYSVRENQKKCVLQGRQPTEGEMGTKKETESSDCRWVTFPEAEVNDLRWLFPMARDLPTPMTPQSPPDHKITSGVPHNI